MPEPERIVREVWYDVSPQTRDAETTTYATPEEAAQAAVAAIKAGAYTVYLYRTERLVK